jgi:phospholipase/carboxylesterase
MSAFMPGKAWFAIDQQRMQDAQFEGGSIDLAAGRPLGLDEAVATVSEFLKSLEVPVERLILGGFSQGAMVALELAFCAPRTPLGLFLMSPAVVDAAALPSRAAARPGLKFFQSHGTHDPLLSFDGAHKLHDGLIRAGWNGDFVAFPGGHGVSREVLDGLSAYLDSLPRDAAP